MKNYKTLFIIIFFCPIMQVIISSCNKDDIPDLDFRQEMRDFVIGISTYSNNLHPGFIIVPQNGIEMITNDGESDGDMNMFYLDAISGHGQEDLFYGYDKDDKETPAEENEYLRAFLDRSKTAGKVILVTDYCSTANNMADSYSQNLEAEYVSFAADHRELDNIPAYPLQIHQENDNVVAGIDDVKNFLYLINTANFQSKEAFINAVTGTNYDLLIMDLYFEDNVAFNAEEINRLKDKANGGNRIILCYLSIGEAEDYRYYWKDGWKPGNPSWLDDENKDWEGNYKVKYWETEWQYIIYGMDDSYLKKILDAGFDGAYLDIIDAYEYFE